MGEGGLTAVVCGKIYSSPTQEAISCVLNSLKCKEILVIVKNYTGDRINFTLAVEKIKSQSEKKIQILMVADDVSFSEGENSQTRGLAGTVFVHKVAGALSEQGLDLTTIFNLTSKVSKSIKTFGVSFSSCILPSTGKPMFQIPDGFMELGLGIHGEKGSQLHEVLEADLVVKLLLDKLLQNINVEKETPLAVMLNNLGSVTNLEMSILTRGILNDLKNRGWTILRFYSGQFLTSLDTLGISITLLPVNNQILHALDYPTKMISWACFKENFVSTENLFYEQEEIYYSNNINININNNGAQNPQISKFLIQIIKKCCFCIKEKEPELTNLDTLVGDGDLGTNLSSYSDQIISKIDIWDDGCPSSVLKKLAETTKNELGGTSGPLYTIFIMSISESIYKNSIITVNDWIISLEVHYKTRINLIHIKERDKFYFYSWWSFKR